jgi:hypothetical protein
MRMLSAPGALGSRTAARGGTCGALLNHLLNAIDKEIPLDDDG